MQLLKKIMLGVAMITQFSFCFAQDSEETLNQKYWTMRERFRKYFVSIGKEAGQGIPAAKKQSNLYGGARCSNFDATSTGTMSWGDATSYLGDYMCTLATEYALLTQEGKDTKATLNELYYALYAIDRLDGIAENTFNNSLPVNYNGFFLRDDVQQSTISFWNNQYSSLPNTLGSTDPGLNYKCFNSDRDINFNNEAPGNSCTNEPSFDQISNLFTGFSFIKKYVPNVFVKPSASDVGFNIISKMQSITANLMDYMSGADRLLQRADHPSENLFNYIAHPTPAIFGPGTPLAFTLNSSISYIIADADCGNNDIRGNWILVNPVTGRKVGSCSNDTKNQDIRLFSYVFAKIAEKLTGDGQYLGRDIHHEAIDHFGDGYYCLSKHDYHIPLSVVSAAWNTLAAMPSIPEDLVFTIGPPILSGVFSKPLAIPVSSLPRNFYIIESLGATSGTWSHSDVNKFANQYGHENVDLVYSCLNDNVPQNSQQHYIDLLSKLTCDGPFNYGPTNFTSFWNNGNSFENPTYDNIDTESFNYGEYNANDWMWLYNMYRLKFGNNSFPSYTDNSCNCKTNTEIDQHYDVNTTKLTNSLNLNRIFYNYLNLGISIKEFLTKNLIIDNKILENRTEFVICNSVLSIINNGVLKTPNNYSVSDSIKIVVRNGAQIFVQNQGLLDVGKDTKVIIQKGATLKASNVNSRIIVRNGGKLIIEPGAFLELNNGSKLIVENGGQVIIQADLSNPDANINGTLTYNQGANIQLNGNNAVLEINGRLHIGDNAIFSFTHPGSNSGYIKFNRGQGVWWDNWAPNNAHITCGNNSRIVLQGQNKNDKIIDINQINVAIPKNLAFFILTKGKVEFNDPDARIETDRPTIISNSTFIAGSSMNGLSGRGLLVFGQPTCIINNCDFTNLNYGVIGALFYSGTKLNGVNNCHFTNCGSGIRTVGGGVNVLNNDFLNVADPLDFMDATANSLVKNNTVNVTSTPAPFYALGIGAHGVNVEFDIQKNTINNVDYAILPNTTTVKLSCNDLQNNKTALFAAYNSKVNMSNLLGAGYNNANNCDQFARFIEANTFEANEGFNNFQIANGGPCVEYPASGHGPTYTPAYTVCPTITEGSLINLMDLIDLTQTPPVHHYLNYAEKNFWRPLISPTDAIEDRQNKIRKIDLTDINNPILDSASLITGNVLTNTSLVTCPTNGSGGNNCNGVPCRLAVHPLDDNSNSSIITTASFYNKKLQKALQFSLNKMDKMQNSNKVNQAANLLTECLTYNYATPVTNSVDKYLLELAYQKLYTCVAQLTEWHRDTAITFNPIPASLQNRFNDLHTICALRAGRKSINESDYKEIHDLILLDKAMIYRLADDRNSALNVVNNVIATSPKASQLKMYEGFRCIWSTEQDAINGNISVDKALADIKSCNELYYSLPQQPASSARMIKNEQISEVTYASEHAIAVFPNPTNGNLSVAYNLKEFKNVKLEIIDVQGKIISSYILNPEDKLIEISNLNLVNGVYFYKIIGDQNILMSKKLVVLK